MGYKTGVLIFHQPYQQRIKANILKFDPWLATTAMTKPLHGAFLRPEIGVWMQTPSPGKVCRPLMDVTAKSRHPLEEGDPCLLNSMNRTDLAPLPDMARLPMLGTRSRE